MWISLSLYSSSLEIVVAFYFDWDSSVDTLVCRHFNAEATADELTPDSGTFILLF